MPSSSGYSNDRVGPRGCRSVSATTTPLRSTNTMAVGADARPVVGEHGGDGAGVMRGDRLAKREIAREHSRGQLELLGILVEQAREYALADVEFFGDLGLRITGIGGVHEPERGDLHQCEQRHEEHDDAGL